MSKQAAEKKSIVMQIGELIASGGLVIIEHEETPGEKEDKARQKQEKPEE